MRTKVRRERGRNLAISGNRPGGACHWPKIQESGKSSKYAFKTCRLDEETFRGNFPPSPDDISIGDIARQVSLVVVINLFSLVILYSLVCLAVLHTSSKSRQPSNSSQPGQYIQPRRPSHSS